MGVVFDVLLLILLGYSMYMGYKNGFLVSTSGIIAIILAAVLTGMFTLGVLGFIMLNMLLSVAVSFTARIIRKLKLPLVRTADKALGIGFGFIEGAMKIIILSLIACFIKITTTTDFFEGSLFVEYTSRGAIYSFIRSFVVTRL